MYPHFIAVDASSFEDEAHPVAIAWSLADGTIKTTLIQPEDDWEDWDYALEDLHGITRDTLYQRGETPWSVVREMENDLEQPFLFCEDVERTDLLLEKLYEACGREPTVETGRFTSELSDQRDINDWMLDTAFQHQTCDERVRLMLTLWVEDNQP